MQSEIIERFTREFGSPSRKSKKVQAWNITPNFGVVVQVDVPMAYVWIPHPPNNEHLTGIILKEYPAGVGRHSNTYASPGLSRGLPAIRATIANPSDLDHLVNYIKRRCVS